MLRQFERETSGRETVIPEYHVVTSEPFTVVHLKARFMPESIRGLLNLSESDYIWEIHIPEVVEAHADAPTREHKARPFRETFDKLADHLISTVFPQPLMIVGITHQGIAYAAKIFFGFDLVKIDESLLDESRHQKIREGWAKTKRGQQGLPMGNIFVCHQPIGRFMVNFNGH